MSEPALSPLSPAQREAMEIIWERGELSAFELREILGRDRRLARETVRTMLQRMEDKGWLTHRVVGKTFFYRPAVSRDVTLGRKLIELVDTLAGGSPERLMAALLEHRGLSRAEAERIEAMIARAKKGRK